MRALQICIVLLLLAAAIYGAYMLFRPEPDVSSSINVETSTDEDINDDNQEFEEDSFLSRINPEAIEEAKHPLDPLMDVATVALEQIDDTVADYTATIVSQVRLNRKLQPEQKMSCKIRHARTTGDDQCGLSIYLRFLKPDPGQEVIWVDGWNDGKLAAHAIFMGSNRRADLKPDSMFAMMNSLHPVTDIGFRNLLAKILDKGNRDREHGECEVTIKRNLKLAGRKCVMLEVKHPVKRAHFEFHIARIYLDEELEIPIGYEGFLWPKLEGGDPILLEKYFYTDLKLNVGLTDSDFDTANEAYDFPKQAP